MILPRSGAGLPPWRRQVSRWLMAGVRLAVGTLVSRAPLELLVLNPSFVKHALGTPLCFAVAALLAAGVLAFAWPATYLAGCGLLLAGLGVFEWLWHRVGQPVDATPLWSAALLAVLTGGEWLTRRVQARLY